MNKSSKVKVYKAIYYTLSLIITLSVCFLGSLILNTDIVKMIDPSELGIFASVSLMMILAEGTLSYKLYQLDR